MKDETQTPPKKRFPRINIVVVVWVLILLVVAGLVILKVTHKHKGFPITIGSTRITVQDVDNYANELKAYSKQNPNSNFGGTPTQVAVNDLVLNAAFKQEAQKLKNPLTDNDIAEANSYGGTLSTTEKLQFLAQFHAENTALQTRAQNIAYEQKFSDTLIAKKNLMVAGIDFDTPYFANAPKSQVQSLYNQAKARVQNTIIPLMQQKASDSEISNHVDLSFKNGLLTKGTDNYQQYFQKAVLDMDVKTNYTEGESLFNDINSTSYLRGNVGKLYSTNAKIDSLKNVGDYTDVFASKAGIFMVIRLDSKTGGSYNSWSDYLAHYKQMYGLTSTSLTKQLGTKVASSVNNVVESLASLDEAQASADTPSGGCGQHNVQFTARSWDTVANVAIGGTGTTFQESRASATYTCPGSVSGTATATTGGPNNTIDDNCFAPAPSWAVNSLATGYTPVGGGPYTPQPQPYPTPGATWDNTAGGQSVAIRSGPDSDISNGDDFDGWPAWTPGTINETGHIYIVFLYKGNPPQTCEQLNNCPTGGDGGETITCSSYSVTADSGDYKTFWIDDGQNTELGDTNTSVNGTSSGSFTPLGQTMTLHAYSVNSLGDDGTTHTWTSGPCYAAQCSLEVDGNLPDGGVLVGSNYTVTATFINTGPTTLPGYMSGVHGTNLDLTMGSGGGPGPGSGASIPPGGTDTFTFTETAPGSPGGSSVSGYADYYGDFSLGGPSCSTGFNVETRSASCSIDSIVGTLPGGYVQAGQSFTVNATVTNTGTSELASSDNGNPFSLNYGDNNGANSYWSFGDNNLGVSLFPGQSVPVTFTISDANLPSPPDPAQENIFAHVAYSNDFALGGQCSSAIDMYVPFTLTGGASSTPNPNNENPSTFDYKTWVTSTAPVAVNASTTSSVYKTPVGTSLKQYIVAPTADGGPFGNGQNYVLNSSASVIPPLIAGDEYLGEMDLNYTSGYVGANGPSDVVDTSGGSQTPGDFEVHNEPYVHFLGSDVSAGGGFNGSGSCANPGGIYTYTNGLINAGVSGLKTSGSSVQIGALSLGDVQGFNSAGLHTDPTGYVSPTGLTFSNKVNLTGGAGSAPNEGGDFGGIHCITNYVASMPTSGVTTNNVPSIDLSSYGSGATVINDTPPGGTLNLNASSGVADGASIAIYVTGDVNITGNIEDASTTDWTKPSDIPSLYIIDQGGTVRVNPSVTQLDGIYVSQPDNSNNGGFINTCSSTATPTYTGTNLLADCNNQLQVNGAFVAKQVYLDRSFGSLRDEAPIAASVVANPQTYSPGPQLGIQWSSSGAIPGMQCTQFNEDSEPSSHTWEDNYLCAPPTTPNSSWGMCWGQAFNSAFPCSTCNFQAIDLSNNPYFAWLPGYWQDNAMCPDNYGLYFWWGTPPAATAKSYHYDFRNGQTYINTFATSSSYCTQMSEDSDPTPYADSDPNGANGVGAGNLVWEHTYICEPLAAPVPNPITYTSIGIHFPAPPFTNCSNAGTQILTNTCAAEIFNFSPEFYLNQPAIERTTGPTTGKYDFITSLSPVL